MVIVVGGGAAGIFAAFGARDAGKEVLLIEKNKRLGRKICITGKGRCNLTNNGSVDKILEAFGQKKKFLMSPLDQFSNIDLLDYLRNLGIKTKIERGERVFPESDSALSIVEAFTQSLKDKGISVITETKVESLILDDVGNVLGVKTSRGNYYGSVILATGGLSYPKTGSTGDGYQLAKQAGHTIVKTHPSLVPLKSDVSWVKSLQGLSLKNVQATLINGQKAIASEFGEMLFTHFGVSGPIVLTLSQIGVPLLEAGEKIYLTLDLKPALTMEQLDKSLLRIISESPKKQIHHLLEKRSPKKLIPVLLMLSEIDPNQRGLELTKGQRQKLCYCMKHLKFSIDGHRGYDEAIVTQGGIQLKEINPKTLGSKKVAYLSIAGELLDLDGVTGGYNLQEAFSTGYLAGWWIEERE